MNVSCIRSSIHPSIHSSFYEFIQSFHFFTPSLLRSLPLPPNYNRQQNYKQHKHHKRLVRDTPTEDNFKEYHAERAGVCDDVNQDDNDDDDEDDDDDNDGDYVVGDDDDDGLLNQLTSELLESSVAS